MAWNAATTGSEGGSRVARWLSLMLACALATLLRADALAQDAGVPPPPSDPAGAKTYAVLDGACSGCHQVGKLKGLTRPAGNLGNILNIEALARSPWLIQPGNPDASPLYQSVHGRSMPPEANEAVATEVTVNDLITLRDWIEQLPPTRGCGDRSLITPAASAAALDAAAERLGSRAATTRLLSLVPLSNACSSDAEIASARAALTWLVNALSLGLDPIKLPAGGPSELLLEVDIAAIGWTAERWDKLAARAPASAFLPVSAASQKAFNARVPVVDGAWFADETTQSATYYDLIGIPATLNSLLASLNIDAGSEKKGSVDRIGIKSSSVARGNRLLERRPFANGAAWLSREYAPTAGRPDLFDQTIAAAGAVRPGAHPQPDATLVHFDLPNGFPAYFMADASGQRIGTAPASMLRDEAHPTAKFSAAQSCISCHGSAATMVARTRVDDLRARLQAEASLSKEQRDKLLAGHSEPADWLRLLDEDRSQRDKTLAAAGLPPSAQSAANDPLPQLIVRYQRPVALAEIEALTGAPPQRIFELSRSGTAALADVAQRLAFGPVPRRAVDAVLPELARRLGMDAQGAPSVPETIAAESAEPQLVLKAERPTYQPGDLLVLTVRSNFNCHLTLMTLDGNGRATVLYPNEFQIDPQLEAGREVRFPSERAPYQFRLKDKGQETLIATCGQGMRTADGIQPDYEKQRFTELGNYRAFINRSWRPGDRSKGRLASQPASASPAPDQQARTAIRIRIEP